MLDIAFAQLIEAMRPDDGGQKPQKSLLENLLASFAVVVIMTKPFN